MRSTFDIVRHSVAIGALIVAVNMLAGGAPLAYGAPGCDGACNITPSIPGVGAGPIGRSTGQPSGNGGGGSNGVQPGNPSVKTPPVPVVSNRPVIQRLPERPPAEIPTPRIPDRQPVPNIPAYTPPPEVAPVVPAPVAVAPAPPAEIPIVAPPPAAPPAPAVAPVPRVFFTNISEPMGTQSATLIVLFMACGCWIYGNRIASRMTERKTEHAPAGA